MRIDKLLSAWLAIFLTLFLLYHEGRAEGEEISTITENGWVSDVSGNIINLTEGAKPPQIFDLMLHVWNQTAGERDVIHIDTLEDGSFVFENVKFEASEFLTVMAVYEGATYLAQHVEVKPAVNPITINIPVYEVKNDLSLVTIDQMQVFLFHDIEGLKISEVYVLSNRSDRTVAGAEILEDGTPVTLKFELQTGAENITFNQDREDRFLLFPGGFADTAPLIPGSQNTGIMLSYIVPYEDQFSYTFTPKLPVGAVAFLTPVGSGLELSGIGVNFSGVWPLRDGSTVQVYEQANLLPGENFSVNIVSSVSIEEKSAKDQAEASLNLFRSPLEFGMVAGGAVIGVSLFAAGVWIWRRKDGSEDEIEDEIEEEDSE
jgi:hypothetical protein